MSEELTFGQLIRRVRSENEQTQNEAAAQVGVKPFTWSRWELGALPTLKSFYPVLDYLEMSAEELRPYLERTFKTLDR
jgi:transcriptional regulator with XRE-family HTH domain